MPRFTRAKKWLAAIAALAIGATGVVVGSTAAQAAPLAQSCSYADAGSGQHARSLCWLDMSGYDAVAAGSAAGQEFQLDLPGGYTVSYTLKTTGRTVFASGMPTWTGAPIGATYYTGIAGNPTLYHLPGSPGGSTTAEMSDISVTDPNGAEVTSFAIVGSDVETTDIGESFAVNSDKTLRLLEDPGNACDTGLTGEGTNTITCTSNQNLARTGGVMAAADDPDEVSMTFASDASARRQGAGFAILLPIVKLNKTVASRVDPADTFGLEVAQNDNTVLSTANTGTATTATTGEVPILGTTPQVTALMSETGTPRSTASYTQSWVCTNNGTALPSPPTGDSGSVTVAAGEVVECTITNTARSTALTLQKVAGPVTDVNGNGIRDAGDTITYSFNVTNSGDLDLENLVVNDPLVGAVTCPVTSLGAGDSTTCTADNTYTFTSDDEAAGGFTNTAQAVANPIGGTREIDSNTSSTTTTLTAPAPALALVKSANPTTITAAGQSVSYSFVVTNTGNVPVESVAIAETDFSGTGTLPAASCPVTVLAPTASTTCTATYIVTQDDIDAGTITNTARADGEADGDPVSSTESSASVIVTAAPAISLVKSASPNDAASFVVGTDVTYTFVATNTGNVTLSDIAVTETSFSGSGGPLTLVCPSNGPIAPGGQVTCTADYTITQDDVDAGEIENTAEASGTPPTGAAVTSPPASVTIPGGQTPELTLLKEANRDTVALDGDEIEYTFTVTNTGNVTITDVTVDETAFSGSATPPVITCPVAELAVMLPGAIVTCTATYTINQDDADGTEISNTATATGNPPASIGTPVTSDPSTAIVDVVQNPELTLVKSANPAQATGAGDTIDYSFLVTNTGDVTITDINIDEIAFSGTGTAPVVTCPAGAASLAPGDDITCTASYTLTQSDANAGTLTNTATATGNDPLGGDVVSPESDAVVPVASSPALTIVKTPSVSEVQAAGDTITYSFLVTNTGNVTVTDVVINEDSFTGTGTAPVATCPAGAASLAPGSAITCSADYTVTQADIDAGIIDNAATATGTPPTGPDITSPPSAVDVEAAAAPALELVKSVDPGVVAQAGDTVEYSFDITNTGNVTLTDVAPVEGAFSGTGTAPAISCPSDAASLAPGDSVTCTGTYTVTQADIDAGAVSNTATATGTPPGGLDPIDSSPSSANFTAPATPHLVLEKTASPSEVTRAGQEVMYSFVVTNDGNVTMTRIAIEETSFSGTGTPPQVVCPTENVELAPGDSVTCTALYTATQADVDAGELTNTAVVSGAMLASPDDRIVFDPSSAIVGSPADAALSLVKSSDLTDAADFIVGAEVTYSFVITNTGNVTISNVSVAETSFTGAGTAPAVACPAEASSLAPGQQVICTATYVLTQADVDAGSIDNTAVATGSTPDGDDVTSDPSSVTIPSDPQSGLALVKSATVTANTIDYRFTVTNTGNTTITAIDITEQDFSGTGTAPKVTCPAEAAALLPGAVTICSGTYTITDADRAAGTVHNTAIATGDFGGDQIVSDPSTASVQVTGLATTGGSSSLLLLGSGAVLILGGLVIAATARRRKTRASTH